MTSIGMLAVVVDYDADGQRSVTIVQADPVIEIADRVLAGMHPWELTVGDGIVTVHARNGDVSYGLCKYDELRRTWLGVRSGDTEGGDA